VIPVRPIKNVPFLLAQKCNGVALASGPKS